MVKNLMADADVVQTLARIEDGTITKGMLIKRGNLRGIALNTAKPGEPLRLHVSGVWTLAKIAKPKRRSRAYKAGAAWASALTGKRPGRVYAVAGAF